MLCLVVFVAAVAEQPLRAAARQAECPVELPQEVAALAAARLCGSPVRVGEATAEASMTWANPDGSLSTQMDAGPVRFRRDGVWVDIDVDLQRETDGAVRAPAHPSDVDLFGGDTAATRGQAGDRALVTVDAATAEAAPARVADSGNRIALAWKGGLPQPVLSGDTATYPDAKPGTDVVVQLTATGFRQHTVLKERPTTPVSLTMPVKLDGLTARRAADGAVEFLDSAGAVAGVMPQPSMWDSRVDAVSQLPTHSVAVAYTLATKPYGVDVTLTPDVAYLSDPAVRYPVTIDPDISFPGTFDTYVRQNTTTDLSASGELAVGVDASGNPARAFLNWDPAAIRGKHVVEAHLGLWNTYSRTCGIRAIEVHAAGLAGTATRWTAQPAITTAPAASTTERKACPAEPDQGYIHTPAHTLDALVQSWADSTSGQRGTALVAPSETDVLYYKAFASGDGVNHKPYIYLTYTSIPPVPGCHGGVDGDFNGDGVRDTAIADPRAPVNGLAGAGTVNVVDGATGAVTTLREGSGGIPDMPEADDRFGAALAVYDTNLDGCADLAIGAPFEDSGTVRDAGTVFVVYGAPGGLGSGRATLVVEQGRTLAEGRGIVPDSPEADDWFGYALSAGLTAIGEPYLIIGAPGEDVGGVVDAGLVHYLRDTLNITVDVAAAGAGVAATDDRTGYAIASTPYHIAIGRPGAKPAGDSPFAGSVCLFTHALRGAPPAPMRCLDQGVNGVGDTAEAGDQFGKSVAMVRYRPVGAAAGVTDSLLAVGAPGEDVGSVGDTGMVQQFLLTDSTATEVAALHEDAAGVSGDPGAGDYFGEAVAVANTDPAAEASASTVLLAVGSPGADQGGQDAGAVHVFAAGVPAVSDTTVFRRAGALPDTPVAQELLGAWLGGGDGPALLVSSPYSAKSVYGIAWSGLAAGSAAPTVTFTAGAGGLPVGASFGTVAR